MASIKDFKALSGLRKNLKAQEEARALAEAEAARQAKIAAEEADLFKRSIGEVAPLPSSDKLHHPAPKPSALARQHLADEQAALMESISDVFTYDTLLDTDDTLSYARNGIGPDTLRKLRRGHWVIQRELDVPVNLVRATTRKHGVVAVFFCFGAGDDLPQQLVVQSRVH